MLFSKKIFPFFFLLTFLKAEAQQIFQKNYFTDSATYSSGSSFLKLNNNDYLALGHIGDAPDYDVYLLRLDSIGNIIWSKTFATPYQDRTVYLTATDDSNFIITGYHLTMLNVYSPAYMIKINEIGNILWSRVFIDSLYERQFSLNKTISFNNSYYSVGNLYVFDSLGTSIQDSLQRGIVVKVDSSGQLLWAKQYGSSRMILNDFVMSSDGGFVLTGDDFIYDSLGGGYQRGIYFKVDSLGDPEWAYYWDTLYPDPNVIMDVGDGYLIGGRMTFPASIDAFILKIDYNGNLVWSKKYGNTGSGSDDIRVMIKLSDNQYAYSNGFNSYFLIDTLGNNPVVHSFSFNGLLTQLVAEGDKGLSGIGSKGSALSLFKTDSNFYTCMNYTGPFPFANLNIVTDTFQLSSAFVQLPFVSDTFNETTVNTHDSVFCLTSTFIQDDVNNYLSEPKIFPNPFTDKIMIEMQNIEAKNYLINMYDLTGRIVFNRTFNQDKFFIDGMNLLTKGVYVLQIISEKNCSTKSIIKY